MSKSLKLLLSLGVAAGVFWTLAGCGGDAAPPPASGGLDAGAETSPPLADSAPRPGPEAGSVTPTLSPPTCTLILAAQQPVQNLLDRCCAADELATHLAEYEQLRAACSRYLVQSGSRMTVSSAALASCAAPIEARLAAAACTDVGDVIRDTLRADATGVPECQAAYKGAAASGAACGSPIDCQDGLSCLGYVADATDQASGGVLTEGVCSAPVALGHLCGPVVRPSGTVTLRASFGGVHEDCVAGAWCQRGTCVARAASGTACLDGRECVEGTRCQAGICADKPRSVKGGACKLTTDCAEGSPALFCQTPPGASSGTCRALKPTGEPCETGQCAGACKGGLCASSCGSR